MKSLKLMTALTYILLMQNVALADSPMGIRITGVTAAGNGCPQGTYNAVISPDGGVFSLILDQYQAQIDQQLTLDRKECAIRVLFSVPSGWRFTVIKADYRGSAIVDAGAVVTHQAIYSFDGSMPINEIPGFENNGRNSFRSQQINGPYNDNYLVENILDPNLAPWSPCISNQEQTLYITTFLMARSLSPQTSVNALITLDTVDGASQSQEYSLQWQRCNNVPPGRDPNRPGQYQPGRPIPGRPGAGPVPGFPGPAPVRPGLSGPPGSTPRPPPYRP